jgi:hypothetical protein
MMLGGAFLLASRPAAFLAFLLPVGIAPASRLLLEGARRGDESHLAMGVMACLFTGATLLATGRIQRMITAALGVQFENRELVGELRAAKDGVEALNEQLEARVQERTAELQFSAEELRNDEEALRELLHPFS